MADALELETRKAPGSARTSWNAETRTLEVVASRFADVKRWGYVERLSDDPASWDLSRVASPAGVPFLDSHASYRMADRLGKVTAVTVRSGAVVATVRLADSAAANALVRDLEAGLGIGVSIGYQVESWEADDTGDVPVRTATRITLLEISAVTIAADPGAAVRSIATEETMTTNTETQNEFGPEQRAALVERAGLNGAFLTRHADLPETEFRAAVIDGVIARQAPIFPHFSHDDDRVDLRAAMVDGLETRIFADHKPTERGREFAGLTLVELARRCLAESGQRSGGAPYDVVTRAFNGTSDFPNLLGNVLNKSLARAYRPADAALKVVAKKTTARDFKDKTNLRLGEMGLLKKVNEHGEYKRTSVSEGKESYRLATYGEVFAITRQAIINDDLDAFTDLPQQLARAAAATEADLLAKLLASNPAMGDNVALFHASHKNLGTPAALASAALGEARKMLRQQTGLSGQLISVTPKYLVVGPELETTAEQLLAAIYATKTADVNPFAGRLTLVVEPRLAGAGWYVAADPNEVPGLEYAHLEGHEGIYTESRAGFDVDGLEVKVRLDFGAGFTDWRGWHRNAGA